MFFLCTVPSPTRSMHVEFYVSLFTLHHHVSTGSLEAEQRHTTQRTQRQATRHIQSFPPIHCYPVRMRTMTRQPLVRPCAELKPSSARLHSWRRETVCWAQQRICTRKLRLNQGSFQWSCHPKVRQLTECHLSESSMMSSTAVGRLE